MVKLMQTINQGLLLKGLTELRFIFAISFLLTTNRLGLFSGPAFILLVYNQLKIFRNISIGLIVVC